MDKLKLGEVAYKAAEKMIDTISDDEKMVIMLDKPVTMTGKEIKQKFNEDEEFAGQMIELLLGLKFDKLKRG
jgi:hypothetical protein